VRNALGDILALVDLCDLLGEKLVTPLAYVQDFRAFNTPSYGLSVIVVSLRKAPTLPETVSRTFCEIWAAVLYLVRLQSLSTRRSVGNKVGQLMLTCPGSRACNLRSIVSRCQLENNAELIDRTGGGGLISHVGRDQVN
jgi:hypothetical protein